MFEIEFYETKDGKSELWDFLEKLRVKSSISKDARIQFNQIALHIQLLEENGTPLPETITKHLKGKIWELRPGNNRILYFYSANDHFVLLHQFRKKHRKHQKEK